MRTVGGRLCFDCNTNSQCVFSPCQSSNCHVACCVVRTCNDLGVLFIQLLPHGKPNTTCEVHRGSKEGLRLTNTETLLGRAKIVQYASHVHI
jgi:hypothetical protein